MDKNINLDEAFDILDSVVGNKISISMDNIYVPDDGLWSGQGVVEFKGTRNGMDWGSTKLHVRSMEKAPHESFATLILAFSNFVSSEQFVRQLAEQIIASEQKDEKEEGQSND